MKNDVLNIRAFPPDLKRRLLALAGLKGITLKQLIIEILTLELAKYSQLKEV